MSTFAKLKRLYLFKKHKLVHLKNMLNYSSSKKSRMIIFTYFKLNHSGGSRLINGKFLFFLFDSDSLELISSKYLLILFKYSRKKSDVPDCILFFKF